MGFQSHRIIALCGGAVNGFLEFLRLDCSADIAGDLFALDLL
jgi:hypothetical protein